MDKKQHMHKFRYDKPIQIPRDTEKSFKHEFGCKQFIVNMDDDLLETLE